MPPRLSDSALSPRDVVEAGLCIGCGGCAAGGGELGWDRFGQLKPVETLQVASPPAFPQICPFSPSARDEDALAADLFPDAPNHDALIGRYEGNFVGHVAEAEFRSGGSSGGMVSWVAAELLAKRLVDGVAHVAPADPDGDGHFFEYRISRTLADIQGGARSRYFPVEMSGVLAEIRATPGRYAIVGVPCFIKAVQLLRAQEPLLRERIAFTLGLFCGHMKSARLVESFAWQLGAPMEQVRAVEYRQKNPDRPANAYVAHLTLADGTTRSRDWWHLADGDWGAGFFMNRPCNYCDDVVSETADIAFGDAWVEPYSSDGRGTNVVIVRSVEMAGIVRDAIADRRLELSPVEAGLVIETQAAGFRQRREGLAWRMRVAPPALPLRKRVAPGGRGLPLRRKAIYAARFCTSAISHRLFALSRATGRPRFYLAWANVALRTYQLLAYGLNPFKRR